MSVMEAAARHGKPITEAQAMEAARRMAALLSSRGPLSSNWLVKERRFDGVFWYNAIDGLKVIESVSHECDERFWHHVSVSTSTGHTPTWRQVRHVKDVFVGDGREAYAVFPPADRYVNIAEVLHLWVCLDADRGEVLPRFEGLSPVNGRRTI